jgi:hypothetical protein
VDILGALPSVAESEEQGSSSFSSTASGITSVTNEHIASACGVLGYLARSEGEPVNMSTNFSQTLFVSMQKTASGKQG